MVYHVVRRYAKNQEMTEELSSVGFIGLCKAAKTFDKSRGVSFATYACTCISNEIGIYFRHANRHANDVHLDDYVSVDSSGNKLTYMDILHYDDEDLTRNIELTGFKESLEKAMRELSPLYGHVMEMYFEGLTQHAIAKELNISQSYTSRIIKRAKKKLRRLLKSWI